MTGADLISILQQYDPRSLVVVPDSDEDDKGHIVVMRTEHVRACAIRYPHPNRSPKFASEYAAKNAVYICTVPPPLQNPL